MTVSKETLMAYVDGELSDEERATVEAAMTLDPEINHEIERQLALRDHLHSAFDGILDEPVPERLITAARTAPIAEPREPRTSASASITALRPARRWGLPEWAAMAACLVVGLFLGHQLLRPSSAGSFAMEDGRLVARGALAEALSTQLASEPATNGAVRVALSFRDRAGRYCRTFALHESSASAGFACRDGDRWRINAMAEQPATGSDPQYRTAAGELPPSVMQAVQEVIAGEPLDAAGEAAARQRQWKQH